MPAYRMINVQNANAYFAGRTIGKQWDVYSGEQKDAAILQAKRELSKIRPMREDEPPFQLGDVHRDEYAVYEQAMAMLLRDTLPGGRGELTPSLDEAKERPVPRFYGRYAVDALVWLGDRLVKSVHLV